MTYKPCTLEQIEAQLNDDIVFVTQDLRDLASYPPAGLQVSSEICSSRESRLLFHNLHIDLLHIHFLVELRGELSLPK